MVPNGYIGPLRRYRGSLMHNKGSLMRPGGTLMRTVVPNVHRGYLIRHRVTQMRTGYLMSTGVHRAPNPLQGVPIVHKRSLMSHRKFLTRTQGVPNPSQGISNAHRVSNEHRGT